jgi:hypothetical protein
MVLPKKVGRPSDLTKFYREFNGGQILPLKCDDLHNEYWFQKIGSYLVRSAADEHGLQARLGLKDDLSILIDQRLEHIRYTNTMQYIAPQGDGTRTPEYPPAFARGAMRDASIAVGAVLYTIACTDPVLLRYVASGYAYAEQRMSIVLHGAEDAPFGRKLLKLVDRLGLSWLGARLVGFEVCDKREDLSAWLTRLKVDQKIEWTKSKNNSLQTGHHLRIDIVDKRTRQLSGAFHSAMLWAYVVELWRIPRRAKSKLLPQKLPAPTYIQRNLFENTDVPLA